ncbi:MAG: tetratricopeptide repeat protein [Desulfovibrionaceae bacterium]|nr:tetratricopeptide repeat protein [Desulfovibrionaceae bacterium]
MGVHVKERELKEFKDRHIKKSSAAMLAFLALVVGAFIGNAITVLSIGQNQLQAESVSQAAPMPGDAAPHEADPVALANLEKAAQDNPTDANKWVALGNFCFDHDLGEKAVVAYERALALKPMLVDVWSDLGVMYRLVGRYDKAVEAFDHAAALDDNHITSRFNMGIVYLHDLSNKEAAIKVWKEVLAMAPDATSPTGRRLEDMVRDLEN